MSAAVLFVHGAAGDARIWAPVIAALPDGMEGHALTLTYFGAATWPDDGANFGTDVHARDILAAAEQLGRPVHLVAWSYGVHPALAAVLRRPDLFASAFFYEAALPHYIAGAEERRAYSTSYAEVFGPVSDTLATEGAEASVAALVGPAFGMLSPERRAIYLSNARMMKLLMGGGRPPAKITPRELAMIALPCCAAMGTDTPPVFALPTRALAMAIPDATLREVPGADHFLPETDPARFAGLVASWVTEGQAGRQTGSFRF